MFKCAFYSSIRYRASLWGYTKSPPYVLAGCHKNGLNQGFVGQVLIVFRVIL